ncbi:transposase [Glycocaulis alkaliphilus]|uniref:transposase n=1 Tax=Glycocaulis alkaliphilus TaxID=1434191 RepID=UPI000FDB37E9|nr:transposase [Glycocaulis alkaliphilus]GGB85198.1 hypothetical protein GCM10007417_26530 [Glycocaulis alkaliphilus]
MRKSRFSEEQIISIAREQEQARPTPEVCCAHGISANTFYRWTSKCGGMEVPDARRLRQFENESARPMLVPRAVRAVEPGLPGGCVRRSEALLNALPLMIFAARYPHSV